ncbi:replicative DNA helicase [Gordonia sp. NPDC062954]|uniref:replicative DNA helicase n=1 Tax=Gordonia sp. NPDC062954 TaxID=3364003 RepID=UPI0037C8F35D
MAVVDDRGHEPGHLEPVSGGRAGRRNDDVPAEDFGRQPPQDMAAEQSVLGGMLLSKDAIADVVEKLRSADFYRPAHQAVYDAILELYGKGEPADAVTVSAELERAGELRRVGGAPYLHTLISTVPTAANAGYYAEIVAEKAILRRLVTAGTRIVQFGYAGADGQDVAEVVDRAQAEVYEVTERRTAEDYVPLEELLQPTMDEIDSIASRGGISLGVPTGFVDLDKITNGLHPGQMIIVAARPGVGKALALDTPLPTPTGWTTMGTVGVGDQLLDARGRPTRVVAATDVMTERPCYEVEFNDGTMLVADEEHQWVADIDGKRQTVTTGTLRAHVGCAVVRNTEPLDLPRKRFAYGPYTVAALAGMAFDDPEISMRIDAEGPVDVMTLMADLGGRIPFEYLRGSIAQRRALLAGLLDARATVDDDGWITVPAATRHMTAVVADLVAGLGYSYKRSATGWLRVDADDDVFTVHHKAIRHKELRRRAGVRRLVDVRPIDSVPVRCVEVDNDDHMYLAGEAMVPTHNSTLAMDFLRSCSIHHGLTSAMFSLEMSKTEIVMRLLSAEAKVKLGDMRGGSMTDDDWTRLARRMGEISEAPLFIDDSPNLTMMEIRAKARRLKQRQDLRLVVVDYMQLMTSGKKVESRQQEVSEFSRQLKLLAKELEVPVVAISQLNRGPEQRTDKKPQVSDLRESGCLPASARILRADNGSEVTLGELMATGEQPLVWSLNERMRLVKRRMVRVFPSGRKEVFRVRMASGRVVEATGNHPFLTVDGWIPLAELMVGEKVAAPRSVPEPAHVAETDNAAVDAAVDWFCGAGDRVSVRQLPTADVLSVVGQVAERFAMKSPDEWTFAMPDGDVAWEFVHLLSRLGVFAAVDLAAAGRSRYVTHSVRHESIQGVAREPLGPTAGRVAREPLGRPAGRVAREPLGERAYRDHAPHAVTVSGHDQLTHLTAQLGVGSPARLATADVSNHRHVSDELHTLLDARELVPTSLAAGAESRSRRDARSVLAQVADILDSVDVDLMVSNDVYWDEIASIESIGEQDVFDGTVPGTHNFIANGIALHNSLEQDADMVILLHRPDAFERDDPRAGEADIILGKHRNGPTATITVAHQLHLSKFVDMARG